jgi:hypothetical protein
MNGSHGVLNAWFVADGEPSLQRHLAVIAGLAAVDDDCIVRCAGQRSRDAMTLTIALIALAVFLSGSVIGILAVLVAGIRSDDRSKNLTCTPRTATEALTRRVLGVGVRTAGTGHGKDREPDRPGSSPESDLT